MTAERELAELRSQVVPKVLYENLKQLRDEARAEAAELQERIQAVRNYVAKLPCLNCDHVHPDDDCWHLVVGGVCHCDWGPTDITKDIRDLLKEKPNTANSIRLGEHEIRVAVDANMPHDALMVLGSCGCGHPVTGHGPDGCVTRGVMTDAVCPCVTPVGRLAVMVRNVGDEGDAQ